MRVPGHYDGGLALLSLCQAVHCGTTKTATTERRGGAGRMGDVHQPPPIPEKSYVIDLRPNVCFPSSPPSQPLGAPPSARRREEDPIVVLESGAMLPHGHISPLPKLIDFRLLPHLSSSLHLLLVFAPSFSQHPSHHPSLQHLPPPHPLSLPDRCGLAQTRSRIPHARWSGTINPSSFRAVGPQQPIAPLPLPPGAGEDSPS